MTRSRCSLFLPGVGSSTFWNDRSAGSPPPARTTYQPLLVSVTAAPSRAAHHPASRSASVVSIVTMPSLNVIARPYGVAAATRQTQFGPGAEAPGPNWWINRSATGNDHFVISSSLRSLGLLQFGADTSKLDPPVLTS